VSVILNETFDDCSPADAIAPDGVTTEHFSIIIAFSPAPVTARHVDGPP
jgi:hypothetical protein